MLYPYKVKVIEGMYEHVYFTDCSTKSLY